MAAAVRAVTPEHTDEPNVHKSPTRTLAHAQDLSCVHRFVPDWLAVNASRTFSTKTSPVKGFCKKAY
jgi:hypothetical protein